MLSVSNSLGILYFDSLQIDWKLKLFGPSAETTQEGKYETIKAA